MPPLPNPADHPAAEVLIYDGHCQFCTKQVRRICGWDGKNRIAFLSLHDPVVAQLYPDLSHDEMMKAMVIVDPRREHSALKECSKMGIPSLCVLDTDADPAGEVGEGTVSPTHNPPANLPGNPLEALEQKSTTPLG